MNIAKKITLSSRIFRNTYSVMLLSNWSIMWQLWSASDLVKSFGLSFQTRMMLKNVIFICAIIICAKLSVSETADPEFFTQNMCWRQKTCVLLMREDHNSNRLSVQPCRAEHQYKWAIMGEDPVFYTDIGCKMNRSPWHVALLPPDWLTG